MPINMKDLNTLFTSVTQSKVPSSTIAFMLGLEHGECGGRDICHADQDEQFALHGIKITPDTHHAFQMGAKIGRLKNTMQGRGGFGPSRPPFGGKGRPGFSHDRGFDDMRFDDEQ